MEHPDFLVYDKVSKVHHYVYAEDGDILEMAGLFQEKFLDWSNIERRRKKEGVDVGEKLDENWAKKCWL